MRQQAAQNQPVIRPFSQKLRPRCPASSASESAANRFANRNFCHGLPGLSQFDDVFGSDSK
jgi:hypothetical protein